MALVLISVLVACYGVSCCQVLCYLSRPGAEQFPVHPGQRLLLQFMRVSLHVVAVLISFWSVLAFSHALLSLLLLLNYYCCCYYHWFLLLLLFPQSFWLRVVGAWAGAGNGGRGLWLGCG